MITPDPGSGRWQTACRSSCRQGRSRPWSLLNTVFRSGLPLSEVSSLRVGTASRNHQASLVVRQGKGGKTREAFIPQELKAHLKDYLAWKRANGEDVSQSPGLHG